MTFKDLKVGQQFRYDGEKFIKTETGDVFEIPNPDGGVAWSVIKGERIKEWAFEGDEEVKVK